MKRSLLAATLLAGLSGPAVAQSTFLTPGGAVAGQAPGVVVMCLNASSQAVPCPTTTYGIVIDANSGSGLGALLQAGTGTFGLTAPAGGVAMGGKGSGNLNAIIQADKYFNINVTTTTAGTVVAAGVTLQNIYVTGWEFIAGGTTSFNFFYSTSSSCASVTGIIAGPWPLTTSTPGESFGGGQGSAIVVPVGDSLCIASTGASVTVGGHISFAQF